MWKFWYKCVKKFLLKKSTRGIDILDLKFLKV